MDRYYLVEFESGGIERVGDDEFEEKLEVLRLKCRGEWVGSGFGFGVRDYSFSFKTERSARKFLAELGRRARAWKISHRALSFYNEDVYKALSI